jgi:hypothetical protein
VFIATVFVWSSSAAIATVAFVAGLAFATVLRHVDTVRRLQRVALPRELVRAERRARALECAGPCALLALTAMSVLLQA